MTEYRDRSIFRNPSLTGPWLVLAFAGDNPESVLSQTDAMLANSLRPSEMGAHVEQKQRRTINLSRFSLRQAGGGGSKKSLSDGERLFEAHRSKCRLVAAQQLPFLAWPGGQKWPPE